MRRATIRDVAEKASVSVRTVSNVLNNSGSMRPETRRRVESAMQQLSYRPNTLARSLKTGKTNILGLGLPDFAQPFSSRLATYVIEEARRHGYSVIVENYGNDLCRLVDEANRLSAEGWIFYIASPLPDQGSILEQPFPIVLTGDYLAHGKVDRVLTPNREAVHEITGRLIARGFRSVGLIGAPLGLDLPLPRSVKTEDSLGRMIESQIYDHDEGTSYLRAQGFIDAHAEAGLTVDWRLAVSAGNWTIGDGARGAEKLLTFAGDNIPDAIVCMNDAIAIGAVGTLERNGLRVPEDVSVVGYDNNEESMYYNPPLTTVDPSIRNYAREAVNMLVERINGYDGPVRSFTTDFTIVERDSARFG